MMIGNLYYEVIWLTDKIFLKNANNIANNSNTQRKKHDTIIVNEETFTYNHVNIYRRPLPNNINQLLRIQYQNQQNSNQKTTIIPKNNFIHIILKWMKFWK